MLSHLSCRGRKDIRQSQTGPVGFVQEKLCARAFVYEIAEKIDLMVSEILLSRFAGLCVDAIVKNSTEAAGVACSPSWWQGAEMQAIHAQMRTKGAHAVVL